MPVLSPPGAFDLAEEHLVFEIRVVNAHRFVGEEFRPDLPVYADAKKVIGSRVLYNRSLGPGGRFQPLKVFFAPSPDHQFPRGTTRFLYGAKESMCSIPTSFGFLLAQKGGLLPTTPKSFSCFPYREFLSAKKFDFVGVIMDGFLQAFVSV